MRPWWWWAAGASGFLVMSAASVWAPMQPELFPTGAACQIAPCGTLEDPDRWRAAWFLWLVGALVAAVASAFVLAPRRPGRRDVVLLVASAGLVVLPLALASVVLSVLTSVQGVATAAALVPLAGLAVLGSWARGESASRRDTSRSTSGASPSA
ncbi:membrane associated rhomboid family serine protease [Nocardioides cavernae]|uniref:Membrane associated rhomboid family serine protease n=1 Tax=Nocardioides cavernae TaxID=1921566 RepID=A0A7Y9H2T8_9ACTN|nr:hypothetical protein [Nocardioides cavernae]NYE36902.1 membrane associated rhomboid family serine protease [Nocardioides cavernae]